MGRSDAERRRMLESLGLSEFEDLLHEIPAEDRLEKPINLDPPRTELEQRAILGDIAARDDAAASVLSFLGGGMYDHFIPSALPRIAMRSEFMTAYTPYQAEVAQGTLTAIFEFQSMIAELTGLEVANASLYDGATALAEASLVARAQTRRDRIVVAGALHPHYDAVLKTILGDKNVDRSTVAEGVCDLSSFESLLGDQTAAVVIPYPNFFGVIDDGIPKIVKLAQEKGALIVAVSDPIALAQLTPPGQWGADLCVGEGQPLGVPVSYGGPALGLFAAKKSLVRRLPGRLVGETRDSHNRRGYVLTLQTREQHIRREKATSNICTNQGLMALCSTIYLALLGKEGLRDVSNICFQRTHYAASQAQKLRSVELAYQAPFFREFVLDLPITAKKVVSLARAKNIWIGIDLGQFDPKWERHLLVAVTEKRTREEIDRWVECLASIINSNCSETAEVGS